MLSRVGSNALRRPGTIRSMSSSVESPIIAVIGTTGTGKSQLAIELALALAKSSGDGPFGSWKGAKVINADAMQIYKGLNIATNKVTEEEKMGVEHLLMDVCEPSDHYVVSDWVQDAIQEIDNMHSRREVPIVAGGTLYWVQHLLFPNRLLSLESDDSQRAGSSAPSIAPLSPELRISLSKLSKEEQTLFDNLPDRSRSEPDHLSEDAAWSLHSLLSKLDPVTGARWHWKDSRKIVRSLEIIKESGRKASDVFADQRKVECDSRYPSLIFWLHAEKDQLNPRLDARVEKMVERGLIAEITSFRSLADTLPKLSAEPENGLDPDIDYTHGILQTIGFKEFDKYLSSSDKQSQLFDEAVEQMKLATRKYAKRQVRWIKQQLLPVIQNQTGATKRSRLVALDASDLGRWDQNVKEPAIRALADFLSGHALRDIEMIPQLQLMVPAHDSVSESGQYLLQGRKKIICTICTVDPKRPVMMEEGVEFEKHRSTRQHRNRASRDRRISEQLAMREEKQRERSERRAKAPIDGESQRTVM